MRVAILVCVVPVLIAASPSKSQIYECEAKQSALKKKEAKGECVEFSKGAQKLTCATTEDIEKVMAFGKQCREEDDAKLAASREKYDAAKKRMSDSKAELDSKIAKSDTPDATEDECKKAKEYLVTNATPCKTDLKWVEKQDCTSKSTRKFVQIRENACKDNVAGASASSAAQARTVTLDKNKCQAELEDGTVIASAESEKYSDCSKQVETSVKTAKCVDGAKKFAYVFRRGDMKPFSKTAYCK